MLCVFFKVKNDTLEIFQTKHPLELDKHSNRVLTFPPKIFILFEKAIELLFIVTSLNFKQPNLKMLFI